MKITITIDEVLPEVTGTSSNGRHWTKITFVGHEVNTTDNYPFTIFGDDWCNYFRALIVPGSTVDVSYKIKSNSYVGKDGNKRWIVELDAVQVDPAGASTQPQQSPVQPQAQPQQQMQYSQPQPQYQQQNLQFGAPESQPISGLPF